MSKQFAASAFRAPNLSTETDRGQSGSYDPAPRGGRAFDQFDFAAGPRDGWLGSSSFTSPGLASFALAPAVSTASADSFDLTMRCGCPSCMDARADAEAAAQKTAVGEAAWEAFAVENPGETFLLDDIADDDSTTYVLDAQEGDSVHSQIDAPGDQDWFSTQLSGGQSYKFILTPDDASGDPGSPDLLIEIYNSAGVLVQSYDSGSFGATETATFTPGADGTYYINVKGWTPADVGGYTLTAEINNDGGATVGGPLASLNWGGDDNIVDTDGVTTVQGQAVIHVYFSQTGDAPYGSPDDPVAGTTWDAFAKDAAFAAFACYENIINVKFVEVFTQAEADFIMAATPTAPVILGRMRPPGEANEGLGEFNTLASSWSEEGLAQGGYGFITLIHELGHAMGLAHPHDTGGGSEVMSGVTGDLAMGYTYGDFDLNQGVFTTMSYNDGWQTAPHGNTDGGDAYGYQGTLMALDIAMLQIKYGANTTYNNTGTVYALPTANEPGTFYSCIWDTGGIDWIIAGAGVDCVIDLRPATIEYEAGGGGFVSYAANIFGGFTIAQGVVIENAIGGAGADIMTGNTAANWLMGGLGNDTIVGGDGDDRIEGGADNDSLNGGNGVDVLDYSTATGGITIDLRKTTAQATGGAGTDTITSFEGFIGSEHADNVIGNYGNDHLLGGAGDDVIDGVIGDDLIEGGDGNDNLKGYTGADTLNGDAGDDDLRGGDGNDVLFGGDNNDILDGGVGVDASTGGAGNDSHYVNDAGDTVNEAVGEGTADRVVASVSYTLAAGAEVEFMSTALFSGTTAINLTGNDLAQRLDGNQGANTLSGLSGVDNLAGHGGDDSLLGGAGNDVMDGGTGTDTTNGGLGDDLHYVDSATDVVAEAVGEGSDRVIASVGYTLTAGAEVELLTTNAYASTTALNFTGNAFSQTIQGNAGGNTLDGQDGNDALFGLDGADTLIGGAGNDDLTGGAGVDTTTGGLGDDTHYVDNAGDIINEVAGEGTADRVVSSVDYTLAAGVDVETMATALFAGTGAINLTGNELANRIEGNQGVNTLNGMDGADSLAGYGGNDTLNGGAGNDVLEGGSGVDTTTGGLGNDIHYVDNAADVVNEAAGEGVTDRVSSSVTYALQAGSEIELLTTGNLTGAGAQDLTGNEFGQTIHGNYGVNTLDGGLGADSLFGQEGNDFLIGGGGNDTLTGGAGADQFWFNAGVFGSDTITDFANGVDQIRITGIAGADDFSDLAISTNGSGWALITLPDGSTITLTGVTAGQVDASDFGWI